MNLRRVHPRLATEVLPLMIEKVRYAELLPHEFEVRLRQRPVGYLPIGTLEWHGPHGPLGADFIQAGAILERAARRFGGIVFPPIWVGPDAIAAEDGGRTLVGMDGYSTPPRQLPGSLYWVPEGLFLQLIEAILVQAKRAGFRCIVAEGHGPSRDAFGRLSKTWRRQHGLHLLCAADFPGEWATQNDHAGRNETSILMAVSAESVDLAQLPENGDDRSIGIIGEDPRNSTAALGEELIEKTLSLICAKLEALGV
jgi:creatinine amidohydrolase